MQCVILHGAFGNINNNWFMWLKGELERQGHEVFLEQFPVDEWDVIEKSGKDNVNTIQNLASWTSFFEKNILPHLNPKKELVFFGHSLAPVFILHLVQQYNLKVAKLIAVSPFMAPLSAEETWQFDVVNRTFYKTDFDWERVKSLITSSYVLYGTADPYVPAHFAQDFAKSLKSTIVPVEGGKHLGGELTEFPLLLDLFKK